MHKPAAKSKSTTKSKPAPTRGAPAAISARSRFPAWLFGLLLIVATFLAYLPAWHAGFIWDDEHYVTGNLTLRSLDGLSLIWGKLTATPQYYPLVHTSFWLEYHLWGLNPLGYHLINVLLHACAAILLWRVLARLQLPSAWLAAGIFALHPVAVESVAWVTERKNVLAGVFYFAAALAYLRWMELRTEGNKPIRGSWRWYVFAFALFLAALLSKTIVCSLPAALLLIIWWKRGRIAGRDVWPLLPFFVAGMALGLLTSWLERVRVGALGPEWAFSFPERCLIAGRALWFYAGKLLWPANLTFIYPRWQLNAGVWWQWLFPVAALAVVAVLWLLRKHVGRGPLVAALFFGGTLLPALGFFDVYPMRYSFVADHFQYLASVGLIVLAAEGLVKVLRPIPFAAAVLPLGLAVLSWNQAHIYEDLVTLWQDTLAKNPDCWMADNNLGNLFAEKGQTDEAIRYYQEAIRLKPDFADAYNNLGIALGKKGQIDKTIGLFQDAIRLKPDYADAYINLGVAFDKKGQTDEAIRQYQEAIRLEPDIVGAHYDLGIALNKKGQIDEAIDQFQEVIRLKPDYAEAHLILGNALLKQGRIDEAIRHYQEAVRLKPDYAEAHLSLGNALLKQGRTDEAIRRYQEAVRLKPNHANARYNLGIALDMIGQIDEAIGQYQEAIRIKPDYAEVYNNLGVVLGKKGQIDEAIGLFQEAIRLKPDYAEAHNNLGIAFDKKGRTDEAIRQFQEAARINARLRRLPQ